MKFLQIGLVLLIIFVVIGDVILFSIVTSHTKEISAFNFSIIFYVPIIVTFIMIASGVLVLSFGFVKRKIRNDFNQIIAIGSLMILSGFGLLGFFLMSAVLS